MLTAAVLTMIPMRFVLEQQVGHRAYAENLCSAVDRDERIAPELHPITYQRRLGGLERLLRRMPGVLGALRGRAEVRHALSSGEAQATLFNTQVPAALAGRSLLRRSPYVIVTDITPVQYDRMSDDYGHRVSRNPIGAWFRRRETSRVLRSASAIAPWSAWAARSIVDDYGIDPRKVHVIPTGVDLQRWSPRSTPRAPGPLRLLFVGGDWHRKGGDLVVEALGRLPADRVHLDVVTRSPAAELERCPNATVHRALEPNDPALVELYRASDVLVLPSRAEAFGHVLVEAAAVGLAAIVSPVGAMPEIVLDGVTGIVLDRVDATALERAIDAFLTDPDLASRMGSAARRRAEERFDVHVNARRTVDLLVAAVEPAAAPAP